MEKPGIEKEAKKEVGKASSSAKKEEKKEKSTSKADAIIQKYKGIKNRINSKPAIEVHGTSTTSSHVAGDEHVHQ